jgi:transcriptional regulator with XRE-family HTH domain
VKGKVLVGFSFGRRVALARRRRGLSLAALAAFVGITEGQLRACERGKRASDATELLRLAEGLGIAPDLLASGGVEWTRWCAGAGAVVSPHVFEAPTQYPGELSHDAALPPPGVFRNPADAPPAPPAAPKPKVKQVVPSGYTSRKGVGIGVAVLSAEEVRRRRSRQGCFSRCKTCGKSFPHSLFWAICEPCWRGAE